MKPKICFILLFFWILGVQAFSERPISLPDSVIVPLGGIKAIPLSDVHSLNATIEDENIAHLTAVKNTIFLKGIAAGSTRIQFSMNHLIRYTKVYVTEPGVQGALLTVPLQFKNSSIHHLMVSNNPESFYEPGTLFKAAFPDNAPMRVFYHHYNKSNVPYRFVMLLNNVDESPVRVHVLEGIAGPGIHEISVGAMAAERFFNAERYHFGRIVPVKKSVRLLSVGVKPRQTISGVLELTPLSASKLAVETKVESMDGQSNPKMALEVADKPKGVFDQSEIHLEGDYTVGGHYAYITMGKKSFLTDHQTGRENQGNYGAFYIVNATMKNPFETAKDVVISFMPQAGPANGIFLIDESRLIKTGNVVAFDERPIARYRLSPHETKSVTIKTFAQGGSFYPVSLVIHPLDK